MVDLMEVDVLRLRQEQALQRKWGAREEVKGGVVLNRKEFSSYAEEERPGKSKEWRACRVVRNMGNEVLVEFFHKPGRKLIFAVMLTLKMFAF